MALVVKDRVKEVTTTTGTSNLTLGGAAFGFQSFSVVGNGNQTYYAIYDSATGDWEVGVGTYLITGPTLSRDTVLESSNSGSKVVLAAGTKDVFLTYPAERSVYLDTAGSAVTTLDIGTLGTSTANITTANITAGTISTTPTSSNDLVNKTYVDGIAAQGITYHTPVKYEVPNTTGNLNATYNNGASGVGATLTNAGTLAAFAPDGPTASPGDRILVYNQTNAFENGVYTVTTVGSGSVAWVLTRAADANTYGLKDPNAIGQGDAFFVTSGNTGAGETYVITTAGTITFGTTAITFAQISSAQVYSAGAGLTLSNLVFSITPVGTAGTFGSASSVPVFTTNAYGQITSTTNTGIAISSSAVSGLAPSATTDTTNASNITSGTLPVARLSGSYTGITGVGTLAAGTWNASTIGATFGGTGITSYTVGDLLYADGATSLAKLADVATGNALISGGVGTAPAWGKIGLQTHISGTLQLVNGGTGATDASGARSNLGLVIGTDIPSVTGSGASGTWNINITGNAATATTSTTSTTATQVSNSVTFNNSGAGAASGNGFNGSGALTVSYNTVGAPSTTGTNASGTWGISISGNAATATSATSATTATTATNWGSYGAVPAAGTSFGNANTIGRSDASGYTYFNYINSNTGNSENPTVSQIIVTNGSDNFYRKASLAHIQAQFNNNWMRAIGYASSSNDWNSLGNTYPNTVEQVDPTNFSGSSNSPSAASYTYGLLLNLSAQSSAQAQIYISHAGNDLIFRGGWGGSSWQTWNKVLTNQNYNSYAPTLTGGGASGTWSINITGSAGSAGSVDYNNLTNKTGGTGTYTTSGDYRAPIFYDSDNTGYYGNFAGLSRMHSLGLGNQGDLTGGVQALSLYSNNRYLEALRYSGSEGYYPWLVNDYANGVDALIFHFNGIGDQFSFGRTGIGQAGGSLRAPIFYDSDNTSYYLDPASLSTLNRLLVYGGDSSNPALRLQASVYPMLDMYSDSTDGNNRNWRLAGVYNSYGLFQILSSTAANGTPTTARLGISGGSGYVGIGAAATGPANWLQIGSVGSTGYSGNHIVIGDGTYVFAQYLNGGTSMDFYTNSGYFNFANAYTQMAGSSRAPIFYDSNNTGYYLDPNSVSYLYGLTLAGGSYFRPNNWIQFDSSYGLYWPNNNNAAELNANTSSSYGAIRLVGSRNGWDGFYSTFSAVNGFMYDSSGNGGAYREANGRWYWYYHLSNDCMGIGTSSTSSTYSLYLTKGVYAQSRIDATIFYDTNDTSYYLNPNGQSSLHSATCWSTWYFRSNTTTAAGSSPPLQAYSDNGSGAIMSFHRGGYYAVNMGLDSDNVFRIGGWSAPANLFQMDMSGNLTMAANVTAYSDERLKRDWSELPEDFVERLAAVKNGTYTRTDANMRQVGVGAQSLQELLPEAVLDGEYLSVAYGNAALAACVELAKSVVALRAELNALRAH